MPGNRRVLLAICLILVAAGSVAVAVQACPYCPKTEATLGEKLAQSDAACLVRFLDSKNGVELSMQTTRFEVIQPLPNRPAYKKGETIEVPFGVTAEAGKPFLLMGQGTNKSDMEWSLPIPVDAELGTEYDYLVKAPSTEGEPIAKRLEYYLKFLDSKSPLISNDAFGEFSRAQFEDVKQLIPYFDREKIRQWLEDPDPQLDVRRSFYGMVLGLCGNDDDAAFLENKIFGPIDPSKNRLGIEGMMGGYLMLRGQPGLQTIMTRKFDTVPKDLDPNDLRSANLRDDLFAIQTTLRFLWDYCKAKFSEESLRAAMRRFLERPDMAELVVADLARWKDWKSLDQLIAGYGKNPWEIRLSQEKVVAFALSCLKDARTNKDTTFAEQAAKAQKFLDGLDPEFVQSVKRSTGGLAPKLDSANNAVPADEPRQ